MPLRDFSVIPLSNDLIPTVFCCGDSRDHQDLSDFLLSDASTYQDQCIGTTKFIVQDNKIIGYFTLCTSEVRLKEKERAIFGDVDMKTYPAAKLARFAIQREYQNKGIGAKVIRYLIGLSINLNETIGCRFVLVDAIPQAVSFYTKMGFLDNLSYKKRKKPSLRLDIFADLP